MTGEEMGTGVKKESGDPCSTNRVENLATTEDAKEEGAAAAVTATGEGLRHDAAALIVDGDRGQQQQHLEQQQQQEEQQEPKSGSEEVIGNTTGSEVTAACAGGAAAVPVATALASTTGSPRLEDKLGVNLEGTVVEAAGTSTGSVTSPAAKVERASATSAPSSQGNVDSSSPSKAEAAGNDETVRTTGGIADNLVRAPETASVPPQVISDAIVAAYQRGFQQGFSASASTAISTAGSPGIAVPPTSPVAMMTMSPTAAVATTASSSIHHVGGPSSLLTVVPSPQRRINDLVPSSLGTVVGSPLSPDVGFVPTSPPPPHHAMLGLGVPFRVPPSRVQGPMQCVGGDDVEFVGGSNDTNQPKGKADASKRWEEPHSLSKAGAEGPHDGRDGNTDDGNTESGDYDDDDDSDDRSVTLKKRERARARANNRKGYIEMIAQKKGTDMTEYERNELKSWEERRDRKNNRSRARSMEKKSRIQRILDTPDNERSEDDILFLHEYQERRNRKNEGDRLRRERIRKMAGCGPKPPGVTVTARGPIKLPTGQVVEREEEAVAVLGQAQPKKGRKKSLPHKRRKYDAMPTPATSSVVVPTLGAPGGLNVNVPLPPAFLPPPPAAAMLPGHATLLPTTAMYPQFGALVPPKAFQYAGRAHGGDVVHHLPSLAAMHRVRQVGGGPPGMGNVPYPPFFGGGGSSGRWGGDAAFAATHGPSSGWSAPPLHRSTSAGIGRHSGSSSSSLPLAPPQVPQPPSAMGTGTKRAGSDAGPCGH